MEESIYQKLRTIIHGHSGIALSNDKKYLLQNRLQKRLRALQLGSEREYLELIESDLEGPELIELIDAISTNTTHFFREAEHFALLDEIFETYRAERRNQVKLWCAAASSGEEPYTLAISAHEHLDLKTTKFRMLATDICTKVLARAAQAEYRAEQIQKVPVSLRAKYFLPSAVDPHMVQVQPALRQLITFKILNLARFPFPLQGPLDVIFCRNVMIYFDRDLRQKIITEFERLLSPGGFLFLSHAENLLGIAHSLQRYNISVFRKAGGA
jgi:chemotaxis protein methyltransferase CheR